MAGRRGRAANLPLEAAILLIGGLTLLVTGALLFPVGTGNLRYYEDGLVGILLVVFSVQLIALGKTPFGDVRVSRPVFVGGIAVAATGIVTGFIPDLLGEVPRVLLGLGLALGGSTLLVQMYRDDSRYRTWARLGGVFRHLIAACTSVYVLGVVAGVVILVSGLVATHLAAVVALAYGSALVYLALVLRLIYARYPEAEGVPQGEGALAIDKAMLLFTGVFMVILGLLLIPVSLGRLPFAGSAQIGLLMIILAIQMVTSGSTPIGSFPRTWPMVGIGLLFAALGVASALVPDVLVPALTLLIGVLNVVGGAIALVRAIRPLIGTGAASSAPPILRRLFLATVTMNSLTVLFGASMLVAGLVPPLILGGVLAANGGVLLYLLHILLALERLPATTPAPAAPTGNPPA